MNVNEMMELSFVFMEFDKHISAASNKTGLGIFRQKLNRFLDGSSLRIAFEIEHSKFPSKSA
jgi:hypothetical protein